MKKIKRQNIIISVVVILILLFFSFFQVFFVLEEGEVAIITQFGEVVGTETHAGLHFKMPILHNVNRYTAKLLRLDGDPQKILTKEKQFIEVDTTSRWRISDIKKFYQSLYCLVHLHIM